MLLLLYTLTCVNVYKIFRYSNGNELTSGSLVLIYKDLQRTPTVSFSY